MHTIEIDFEVFKALTALRETENVTCNDVIRGLVGLSRAGVTNSPSAAAGATQAGDWVCKGVRFPAGTEFRGSYKGAIHYGKVEAGQLFVDGRPATSPSAAACLITRTGVNGWTFWECRFPGESRWRLLKSLRNGR